MPFLVFSFLSAVFFFIAIFLFVVFGCFTADLAKDKGYEYFTWFLLGLFFGPIALVAIGFKPDKNHADQQEQIIERLNLLLEAELYKKQERERAGSGGFKIS